MKIVILALFLVFAFAAKQEDLITTPLPGCGQWDFDAYSGYIPIDSHNKFHYFLVESQDRPESDPLVIWFNGGPGCSSLLGFFNEHGPCVWDGLDTDAEPHNNEYSWNANANVLYVENPAGVGFNVGYQGEHLDDIIAGEQEEQFVLNFYKAFPEYLDRELFITGESYGGIYVPYLAYNLHKNGHTTKSGGEINLVGIGIGNGVTDWDYDTFPAYIAMSYTHGLINLDLATRLENADCDFRFFSLNKLRGTCARLFNEWNAAVSDINIYDVYKSPRDGGLMSKAESVEDLLKSDDTPNVGYANFLDAFENQNAFGNQIPQYLDRNDVREILHVTEKRGGWEACTRFNYERLPQGTIELYPKIKAAGYRILKYSGDTDGSVPTLGTNQWIENLGWDVKIDHDPFIIDGKVAGFYTLRDGLEYVIFHGAGHLVPLWMRKETQYVFNQWLNGERP